VHCTACRTPNWETLAVVGETSIILPQAPQTRIYLLFKIPKGDESFILKILKGEFILYKDDIGISVLHRSWD
jgi:hypothetical protein